MAARYEPYLEIDNFSFGRETDVGTNVQMDLINFKAEMMKSKIHSCIHIDPRVSVQGCISFGCGSFRMGLT